MSDSVNETLGADDQPQMDALREEFLCFRRRIEDRSEDAVKELMDRYAVLVMRIIRRRLSPEMRREFDSDDFCQSVWASFFASRRQIEQFEHPDQLLGYLLRMARNKVTEEFRRRVLTRKRQAGRVRSMQSSIAEGAGEIPAEIPTASEFAIAREQYQRLLQDQPDHYRKIIELRAAGESYQDIAEQLGLNERTVRRAIRKFIRKLG